MTWRWKQSWKSTYVKEKDRKAAEERRLKEKEIKEKIRKQKEIKAIMDQSLGTSGSYGRSNGRKGSRHDLSRRYSYKPKPYKSTRRRKSDHRLGKGTWLFELFTAPVFEFPWISKTSSKPAIITTRQSSTTAQLSDKNVNLRLEQWNIQRNICCRSYPTNTVFDP